MTGDAQGHVGGVARYLSQLDVWAYAFGLIVGWGAFVMPGTTFIPLAGPAGAVLALALGAGLMLVVAANYSYLMRLRHGFGGVYAYTKEAFGDDHAFLCAWFLCLSYISILFLNATALYVVARLLMGGALLSTPSYVLAGRTVYLGEVALSVGALIVSGVAFIVHKPALQRVHTVLAVCLLAGVAALALICLPHLDLSAVLRPGTDPCGTPAGIATLVVLSPWAYVGFEIVCMDTAHYRFPMRKAGILMSLAVLAGAACYIILALASITAVPDRFGSWEGYFASLDRLSGLVSAPIFCAAQRYFGTAGLVCATITALAGILTGVTGAYRATIRILATMAEDKILSQRFLNTSFCIAFVMCIAVVICFTGSNALSWFVEVTSFGAVVGFGYASAAAWRLARQEGHRMIQITGAVGTIAAAVFFLVQIIPQLTAFNTMKAAAFMTLALWCLLGFAFYWRTMNNAEPRLRRGSGHASATLFSIMLYSLLMWYVFSLVEAEESFAKHQTILGSSVVLVALAGAGFALMLCVQRSYRRLNDRLERDKIRAEESNRAKNQFLFSVSHDIRTPLNAIIGCTHLARQEPATPRLQDYLRQISVSGAHLLSLVDTMLELGQLESGKLHLRNAEGNICETFQEAADMMRGQIEAKGIDFRVQQNVQHCECIFDSQRLLRVLLSLLSNAAKFTPKDGHIRYVLEQRDRLGDGSRRYKITVSDSGIGMSRDFADKAFTSFSRERSSTESGLVGSGLGLAITKRIVDAMNGTIGIETAPGKGCTFTILLEFPAVVRIARVKPREEDAPPPFAGKRLLLVDDIEINREIAQVLLENIGFTVDCAEDGAEAVEKVKASDGAYDCIVMDIQMPVMDGYEATRAIRSLPDPRLSSVPVAALTANSLDEDVQTAMNAGMDAHIAKPLDPDVLVATLAKLLNVAPVA